MPRITGLYCAVLPSAVYTFFGSSMQLGVGPVAIVALMMGQLVSKYIPNGGTDDVIINLASQVSMACGLILIGMSVANLGNFIRFISHPVMSGFTSAAAMLIGLSQLKNAFGFPSVAPQTGQTGYDYNYEVMQWFVRNWYITYKPKNETQYISYRNPYAIKICFGLYVPLIFVYILKKIWKPTPERKTKVWFRVFIYVANIMPLVAIIIGASVAKNIIRNSGNSLYAKYLNVVNNLPGGLHFLHPLSQDHPWGSIFADTMPLTLISFMESYSVARRIASQRNELHILNASQELFAIGLANVFGALSSCFPVSGSFSRSSLNAAVGARTPLSKATTMSVVVLALSWLTSTFYYIPSAALAAVIWMAITDLISPLDFWEAWKHSKKDFFVMLVTFVITLVFDTQLGLAAGLGCSVLALLYDYTFHPEAKPMSSLGEYLPHDSCADFAAMPGVEVIRLNNDIVFITIPGIKDYVMDEVSCLMHCSYLILRTNVLKSVMFLKCNI